MENYSWTLRYDKNESLLPPMAPMLVVLVVITQKDPMKSITLWLIKSTFTIFCLKALELDSTITEIAFPRE